MYSFLTVPGKTSAHPTAVLTRSRQSKTCMYCKNGVGGRYGQTRPGALPE